MALDEGDEDDNEPAGVMLLRDLHDMFEHEGEDRLGRTFVVNGLILLEDRPWAEWRHGRPVTANSLTRFLKPFGIASRKVWFRGESVQGYRREDVEDAFNRYVSPQPLREIARLPDGNKNNDLSMAKPDLADKPETEFAMPKPLKTFVLNPTVII